MTAFSRWRTALLPAALVLLMGLLVWLRFVMGGDGSPSDPTAAPPIELARATPGLDATTVQATIAALASTLTALPMTPTPTHTTPSTLTPAPSPTVAATPSVPVAPAELSHVFPLVPAEVASYARAHHDYPATDMFAPEGTEFIAVTDGIIDELSREDVWQANNDTLCTRGGRFVSLVGDDGIRYYGSHLSAVALGIEVGTRVAAGQLLGYIGSSGNARGVAPHLHFGISRPTGPNDCGVRRGEVWPYDYLNQWKAGENAVPVLPE